MRFNLKHSHETYHKAIAILQHYVSHTKTSEEMVHIAFSHLVIQSADIHFSRHLLSVI